MKRLLSTLLSLLAALCTHAASPVCINDTVVKVIRPDSIVVTETDSITNVSVFGRDDDHTYTFSYSKGFPTGTDTTLGEHTTNWNFTLPFQRGGRRTKFSFNFMPYLHMGVIVPLEKGNDMYSKIGWQVGTDVFNISATLPSQSDILSIALGVECYAFRQQKGHQWIKRDGQLGTIPFNAQASHRRSMLETVALTIPVHYTHEFKNTALTLSAIPEFPIHSGIRNRYTIDNRKIRDKYSKLNHRRFDMAFRVSFIYKDAGGIYVQFNPYKTFTGTTSPNFKMLTVGFTF